MIKAIFFDFDGTIVEAHGIAYSSAVRALDDFGCKYSKKKLLDLMGIKFKLILRELGVRGLDVKKVRRRFYKYFIASALRGGIRPCVSLKPLWKLKKDYPLIIVSNSDGSYLRASLKKLKLEKLFSGVYGAEKFSSKDKMLRILFRKMKIKASEAVYVGDRFSDVVFAKRAGCVSVAIHNKCAWSSLKEIEKVKPDVTIRNFVELERMIRAGEFGRSREDFDNCRYRLGFI